MDIPNLAGIATEDLVETVPGASFAARYINWARTMNLLHEHAPGWLPHCIHTEDGGILHQAPSGGYIQVQFVFIETELYLPPIAQAVTGNNHKPIAFDAITATDIVNTQVRGYCKAAAVCFGLGYELWAKDKMESGYGEAAEPSSIKAIAHSKIHVSDREREKKAIASRPQQFDERDAPPWKLVEVHFGVNGPDGKHTKNIYNITDPQRGVRLGNLMPKSLLWYQEDWDPHHKKDKDGNVLDIEASPQDLILRAALDESQGIIASATAENIF